MKILIALALVAFAAAFEEDNEIFFDDVRTGSGCRAPSKFESMIVEILPKYKAEVMAKMYYDAIGQRIRIDETVKVKWRKFQYDVIYLAKQKVEYVINRKSKKCIKRKISRKFWPIAVPKNATRYGEYYIGASNAAGAGVKVATWGGHDKRGDRYFMTNTVNSCVPVSAGGHSRKAGFSHIAFYNVNIGIKNPNVFTPPQGCTSKEEFEDIEDDNM